MNSHLLTKVRGDYIPNENKGEVLLTLEQQLNNNSTSSDGDTGEN